jgi:hypothetical protein
MKFGLATLTAAAFGQVCSDSGGVLFGNTVDAIFARFGVKPPSVTNAQRGLRSFRIATTGGATIGVILGCLLGMINLLFLGKCKLKSFLGWKKKYLFLICLFPSL